MPVVLLLLGKVLLDLPDILVALCGRREDGGDLERDELGVGDLALGLELLEDFVVLDGVVDRGCSEQRVEASVSGSGIVLGQDGLGNRLLGESLDALVGRGALELVVIDMEAEDVPDPRSRG